MDAPELVVDGLTKQFGALRAVDDLSFRVRPGAVTGFLGPNGSGKTTTLRMLLGLTRPSAGRSLVGDRAYTDLAHPGRVVGAALEASSFHPGRTGLGHLEVFAPQVGISRRRCRQVLEAVGLDGAADKRVGGYSMGMRQRLGLATALLADPPVIVLDEPTNGLDPDGIRWIRQLLRQFADEGRTVLVSSHMLREVEASVDDVVIIARGRLRHASSLADLRGHTAPAAFVVAPRREALDDLARAQGWAARPDGDGLVVEGASAAEIGAAAHRVGLELHELARRDVDLEALFFELTGEEPPPGVPAPGEGGVR